MPRVNSTNTKVSPSKSTKGKVRPTLDDVVAQLIRLQGYGIQSDTRLLQMCDAASLVQSTSNPIISPIIGPTTGPIIGPTIGVDEAGRGCLAGPVVAAAVILPTSPVDKDLDKSSAIKAALANTEHLASLGLSGLADSKKLTEAQRDALAPLIRQHALAWGIGIVWPWVIDEVNILQATFLAMARAIKKLRMQAELMLIDGNKIIPDHAFKACQIIRHLPMDNSTTPQYAVVGGDNIIPAISAASILAKTYRDKLMVTFDKRYPLYHFAKHKGYGTKEHLAALEQYGPCIQHRLTFRGVVLPNNDIKVHSTKNQSSIVTALRLC